MFFAQWIKWQWLFYKRQYILAHTLYFAENCMYEKNSITIDSNNAGGSQ